MSSSPTTIIAGHCLRHRKVRRVHDWISVSPLLDCFEPSPFGHRVRVIARDAMPPSFTSMLSSAQETYLAEGPRSASLGLPSVGRPYRLVPCGRDGNMDVYEVCVKDVVNLNKYLAVSSRSTIRSTCTIHAAVAKVSRTHTKSQITSHHNLY
jgi:hypothetical protein